MGETYVTLFKGGKVGSLDIHQVWFSKRTPLENRGVFFELSLLGLTNILQRLGRFSIFLDCVLNKFAVYLLIPIAKVG